MLGPVEAAGEHDVELVEGDLPVVAGAAFVAGGLGSFSAEVADAEVEQLDEGFVGREVTAGFGDLAELVVDALDHVRGVDDLADLQGKGEERDHLLPGGEPLPADRWILLSDVAVAPGVERVAGGLLGGCLIDQLQLGGDLLPVLPVDPAMAGPDQMHDAGLDRGLRPDRLDRGGETGEAVADDDEHVLDAAAAQLVHHAELELGALDRLEPDAEDLLLAVEIDSDGQ